MFQVKELAFKHGIVKNGAEVFRFTRKRPGHYWSFCPRSSTKGTNDAQVLAARNALVQNERDGR